VYALIVSADDFQHNIKRYLRTSASSDVFITQNGKLIALLTNPVKSKLALIDSLAGSFPDKPEDIENMKGLDAV